MKVYIEFEECAIGSTIINVDNKSEIEDKFSEWWANEHKYDLRDATACIVSTEEVK